jgi:hypothetical protein
MFSFVSALASELAFHSNDYKISRIRTRLCGVIFRGCC